MKQKDVLVLEVPKNNKKSIQVVKMGDCVKLYQIIKVPTMNANPDSIIARTIKFKLQQANDETLLQWKVVMVKEVLLDSMYEEDLLSQGKLVLKAGYKYCIGDVVQEIPDTRIIWGDFSQDFEIVKKNKNKK